MTLEKETKPRPSWLDGFQRITTSHRFLPEIDGLRFIAVLAVFLHHDLNHIMAKNNIAKIPGTKQVNHDLLGGFDWLFASILDRGSFGVQLFFVISGFILALPFASHFLTDAKKPSLKAYFIRRLTRLEPPYILALLLLLPLAIVFVVHYQGGLVENVLYSLVCSLFYVNNLVFQNHSVINGVTWTLEIEVQFYILAPLLSYVFLVKKPLIRRLILGTFIVVLSIFNGLFAPSSAAYGMSILYFIQFFLSGFFLADIYLTDLKTAPKKSLAWDIVAVVILILITISLIFVKRGWPSQGLILNMCKVAPALLVPVFCYCAFKAPLLNRFLRVKPIWIIGGMCYSIYLIHLPLLNLLAFGTKIFYVHSFPLWANFALQTIVHAAVVLVFSALFYRAIERPCMDKDWPRKLAAKLRSTTSAKNGAVATENELVGPDIK